MDEVSRPMCLIYCLYATDDGKPRYIGQTTKPMTIRLRQHLADARRGAATTVACWIRARQAAGFEVSSHILQAAVAPADLDLFERHWMSQFAELLNAGRHIPPTGAHSAVARTVIEFLRQASHPGS